MELIHNQVCTLTITYLLMMTNCLNCSLFHVKKKIVSVVHDITVS